MHDFRRLEIWNEAVDLAVLIYGRTNGFPPDERFGLTSQLRSAVVSISSNIAEGAGRGGQKEMARFLRMALGSLAEVESQLEVAGRMRQTVPDPEVHVTIKVLRGKIKRLHNRLLDIED